MFAKKDLNSCKLKNSVNSVEICVMITTVKEKENINRTIISTVFL
jgi:hypothetical protein